MEKSRDGDQRGTVNIIEYNSNGNPARQLLFINTLNELEKEGDVIGIFNDVKCQKASDLQFKGYSSIVKNDPDNKHWAGGVGIIFPTTWSSKEIVVNSEKEAALVSLLSPTGVEIFVATIYVRPGKLMPPHLIELLRNINQKNDKKIILTGDFNAATTLFGSRVDTVAGDHLIDCINRCGLNIVVNSTPTFYSKIHGSWNVLDYMFLSDDLKEHVVNFEVSKACESDHLPIKLSIKINNQKNEITTKRTDWEKYKMNLICDQRTTEIKKKAEDIYNLSELKENITDTDLQELETVVDEFTSLIKEHIDKATKIKKFKPTKDFKISERTKNLIKQKRKIHNLIRVNKNNVDVSSYKRELNKIDKEMKRALKEDKKKDMERKTEILNSTKDSYKKWKIINELSENKRKENAPLSHLKTANGKETTSVQEIVDAHAS